MGAATRAAAAPATAAAAAQAGGRARAARVPARVRSHRARGAPLRAASVTPDSAIDFEDDDEDEDGPPPTWETPARPEYFPPGVPKPSDGLAAGGYDIEEWSPEPTPAVERGMFDSWGQQYDELKDVWVYKGASVADPEAPTLPIDTRSTVEDVSMGWTTPFVPVGRTEYEDGARATARYRAVHEYTSMMQLRSAEAKVARWAQEVDFWEYEFKKINRVINAQVLDAWQTERVSEEQAGGAAEAAGDEAGDAGDAPAAGRGSEAARTPAFLRGGAPDPSDFRAQSQRGAWLYAAALSLGEWCEDGQPVPPAVEIRAREMEAAFHAPRYEHCWEGDDDMRAALVFGACESLEEERYERVAHEGLAARGVYDEVQGRAAFEEGIDWRHVLQRANDLCFAWADRTQQRVEKDAWFDRYDRGEILDMCGTDEEPWFLKEDGRRPAKGPFDWIGRRAPEAKFGALAPPDEREVPEPAFDVAEDVSGMETAPVGEYEVIELDQPTPIHKPFPTVAALQKDTSYADAVDSTIDWDQARFAEGQPLDPDAWERLTGERPAWADIVKDVDTIVDSELVRSIEPGRTVDGDAGGPGVRGAAAGGALGAGGGADELSKDDDALVSDLLADMPLDLDGADAEAAAASTAQLASRLPYGYGAEGLPADGAGGMSRSLAPEALAVLREALDGPPAMTSTPSGDELMQLVHRSGLSPKQVRSWFYRQFAQRRKERASAAEAAAAAAAENELGETARPGEAAQATQQQAQQQQEEQEARGEGGWSRALPPQAVAMLEDTIPGLLERGLTKPSRDEAEMLASQTGLTLQQIQDWYYRCRALRGGN